METFESARIQTAARAVGVPERFGTWLQYAKDRSQFGKPIIKFSKIFNKLAWMVMKQPLQANYTFFSKKKITI